MNRLQSDNHLNRRTVRIRDDAAALVIANLLGVDFGHDERNIGLHAEATRVVDNNRARCHGHGSEFRAHASARRKQADVDTVKRVLFENVDAISFVSEREKLPRRPLGRQETQLSDWELAFLEHFTHLLADGAGRADHRDVISFFFHDLSRPIFNFRFWILDSQKNPPAVISLILEPLSYSFSRQSTHFFTTHPPATRLLDVGRSIAFVENLFHSLFNAV